MIRPTVGRVVWYYPPGRSVKDQPLAAIVAHVHSDTCVNLAIFDEVGRPYPDPPASIRLLQEGEGFTDSGGFCTWMPYQIGQAKRSEIDAEKTIVNMDGIVRKEYK